MKIQSRIGVDLVEVQRIESAVSCWGDHFLGRVYTRGELRLCRGRAFALAARFAAKEAVMKALGAGYDRIGWCDIEVLSRPSGEPVVKLRGRARTRAAALGVRHLVVSLSHSDHHAIAYAHAS